MDEIEIVKYKYRPIIVWKEPTLDPNYIQTISRVSGACSVFNRCKNTMFSRQVSKDEFKKLMRQIDKRYNKVFKYKDICI